LSELHLLIKRKT